MKKLFLFLMAAICLASCGESSSVTGGNEEEPTVNPTAKTPSTQVYVMGKDITSSTRAATDNTATAHFFIRIDNRIPIEGYGSCPSNLYWPKKAGNSGDVTVLADGNEGSLNLDYPYWTSNGNGSKYIYDTTGKSTAQALVDVPSLDKMMAANEDHSKGIETIDFSQYKVIWYVAKKEANGWHVDGVLTLQSTNDVKEIPNINIAEDNNMENQAQEPEFKGGNVEVDIHEQLHKDWDEVKTSIHVRDLVDEVQVYIPIEREYLVPTDDFAIRTYDYALASKVFIGKAEYELKDNSPIKVEVQHQATGITITVSAINHDYIKALQEQYGDGITIEVHSYPQLLTKTDIFSKIKQSTVSILPADYDAGKVKLHISKYAATEEIN